jgi:hypothetical protein
MNRRLTLSISLGALFVVRAANAQEVSIGYQGLPYKYSGSESTTTGIQVSDGVLMHVGIGAEAGYDTNVFYQDTGTVGSPIFRVTPYADITNASRTGATPSGLGFNARAALQYRRYSGADASLDPYRNAWMPIAGLSVGTSATPTLSFNFSDTFVRIEDAPYNPGQFPLQRDNNLAAAEMKWSPGGGRISALLRYTNGVDIFEDADLSYANSLTQALMLDGSWKWLPKTALFLQVQQGYVTYLNEAAAAAHGKSHSFPLLASGGLRGLITEKTSLVLSLGYSETFNSCSSVLALCPQTTGLGHFYARLEGTTRPTLTSRIVLGYVRDFQNSVISTFYYNDSLYASYVQQLGARFAIDLSGRYSHKDYQGFIPIGGGTVQPRVDNSIGVGLTADYFVQNWAYAGLGYSLAANFSDYSIPAPAGTGGPSNSVSYVKQQVFARLGVTY